jgi:acyl carrier protein phosphodiesterase
MNFLAHLYLSQQNTNILIGNFMADGIVGNKFEHYPKEIKQGIRLHRAIDTFTDSHEIVKQSKRRLHERYKHYKGVIIDIFYDHYLAKNWQEYSAIPLDVYVQSVYQLLQDHMDVLPEKTQYMLPYMIEYNWLYNYQFEEGIQRVLNGMNNRTKQKSQMHLAVEDLRAHNKEFEQDFTLFFNDLQNFTYKKTAEICNS